MLLFLFEFFIPALANGFSMGFEWQQVSSSLQNSSQYSSRSQNCCSLDGLHPSCYFQLRQFFYQSFSDCTKSTNYNWYNCHFHVPQVFQFIFHFLSVVLRGQLGQQSPQFGKFFFCWFLKGLVIWPRLGDLFVSPNPRALGTSHLPAQIRGCAYTICSYGQISIFFHKSLWITLHTQSYVVLYSFYICLLHSLMMWFIVSSLSPHHLNLLFCCVLFGLIGPNGIDLSGY